MHWLPKGSCSVGMGGTSFPGPRVCTKGGMVKKSEDMRDVLVHSLLSGDHGTGYPGIDPSRHGLASGNSVAPSLSVWAILDVVMDSTGPCPTWALVRVLIRLDQAQELRESRPASKELDKSCLS